MGRKKKSVGTGVGHAVIKERFKKVQRRSDDSFIHTSELKDGYEWGRLNLQSVTEQNHLDEFLTTAELAGTEFTAEKLTIQIVDRGTGLNYTGLPTETELKEISDTQKEHQDLLRIPRRPQWDETTTPAELASLEREEFLEWRRDLAKLQEVDNITITPFEKNLEFWRQLWRVIERSDIVMQIVDARNPLLFRCEDLEDYVEEVDGDKKSAILVNKSDLLTSEQRRYWSEYFANQGMLAIFWSALAEAESQEEEALKERQEAAEAGSKKAESESESEGEAEESSSAAGEQDDDEDDKNHNEDDGDDDEWVTGDDGDDWVTGESDDDSEGGIESALRSADGAKNARSAGKAEWNRPGADAASQVESTADDEELNGLEKFMKCPYDLVSGEQLIEILRSLPELRPERECSHEAPLIIGLVGYPNVGKSSTINAILKAKKVPVSATPGRTKHFQTVFVDSDVMLCDCPGLVMPSFVSTRADMVVSGILPIDQMRDHIPPVSLVCQQVSKATLEKQYGIIFPRPREGEDPNRNPTGQELCVLYGYQRGFMTAKGMPDSPRTARLILKDYVRGRLLYCHPPPGCPPESFQSSVTLPTNVRKREQPEGGHDGTQSVLRGACPSVREITLNSALDKQFFAEVSYMSKEHQLGKRVSDKKKHGNRHKKEKLRRRFAHLDQHKLL